jgi:hypothetical protein
MDEGGTRPKQHDKGASTIRVCNEGASRGHQPWHGEGLEAQSDEGDEAEGFCGKKERENIVLPLYHL